MKVRTNGENEGSCAPLLQDIRLLPVKGVKPQLLRSISCLQGQIEIKAYEW